MNVPSLLWWCGALGGRRRPQPIVNPWCRACVTPQSRRIAKAALFLLPYDHADSQQLPDIGVFLDVDARGKVHGRAHGRLE